MNRQREEYERRIFQRATELDRLEQEEKRAAEQRRVCIVQRRKLREERQRALKEVIVERKRQEKLRKERIPQTKSKKVYKITEEQRIEYNRRAREKRKGCKKRVSNGISAALLATGKLPIEKGYIYILFNPKTLLYKIGMTINPEMRISHLRLKYGTLVWIHLFKTEDMRNREMELHTTYVHKNVYGEWFQLNLDDILYLKILKQ